ncbi:hypothetical protein GCM10027418_17670 [Mariniluteicoccus endophyticus]
MWARHQLHTLGWRLLEVTGTKPESLTLTLHPADFELVVAHATQRRIETQRAATQADLAWRTVIGDVPARGAEGYVSKARLGEITNHTRVYVDEIWRAQRERGQD